MYTEVSKPSRIGERRRRSAWGTAETADGQPQRPPQFVEVLAAAVLELDPLEQIQDALVGIELGRVAGQMLQVEAHGGAGGMKSFTAR